jgi:hypothetical protein
MQMKLAQWVVFAGASATKTERIRKFTIYMLVDGFD